MSRSVSGNIVPLSNFVPDSRTHLTHESINLIPLIARTESADSAPSNGTASEKRITINGKNAILKIPLNIQTSDYDELKIAFTAIPRLKMKRRSSNVKKRAMLKKKKKKKKKKKGKVAQHVALPGKDHFKETETITLKWRFRGQVDTLPCQQAQYNVDIPGGTDQQFSLYLGDRACWDGYLKEFSIQFSEDFYHLTLNQLQLQRKRGENTSMLLANRLRFAGESRPVFLLREGFTRRQTLKVTRGATLHFGVGPFQKSKWGEHEKSLIVKLSASSTDQNPKTKLYSQQLSVEAPSSNWNDVSLDLSPFQGTQVTLYWRIPPNPSSHAYFISETGVLISQPFLTFENSNSKMKSVILISLDTLRADHLGCYGYPNSTSPTIDFLSRQGATAIDVVTSYPSTAPAHVSLMTGLPFFKHWVNMEKKKIDPGTTTLASFLSNRGMYTMAVTGGGNVSSYRRLDKGFYRYTDFDPSVQSLEKQCIPWLTKDLKSPFLLFYHTYEIHSPYVRHEPLTEYFFPGYSGKIRGNEIKGLVSPGQYHFSARDQKYLTALYDSGIRYTDAKLAFLVNVLKTRFTNEKPVVVLLSDHGEHFGEHGLYSHGNSLYDELLKVPLLMYSPSQIPKNAIIKTPIALTEVASNIVKLCGIHKPFRAGGASSRNSQDTRAAGKILLSELRESKGDRMNHYLAAVSPRYKLLLTTDGEFQALYLLPSKEDNNVVTSQKEVAKELAHQLKEQYGNIAAYLKKRKQSLTVAHDMMKDETKEQLEQLGYLETQ